MKIVTIAVFILASCTERIDIKTGDAPPRLVIYGHISTDKKQHSVRITRSAGFFTTDRPEGVSGALVTITDCDGKIIPLTESEEEDEAGLYLTQPDECGVETKTYRLDVVFKDNDGETKESYYAYAYLQDIHQIDSIDLRASRFIRQTVEVLLYAHNFGEDNNYAIFVSINDSVVNSTLNRYFVINDSFFRGETYIDGVECYFLSQNPDLEFRNEVLAIGDKVTLNINAISAEYADFISSAQSQIRGSNPIFGGPPANVPTNINRGTPQYGAPPLGFFTAFPSRYAHTIVKEDFIFN